MIPSGFNQGDRTTATETTEGPVDAAFKQYNVE